MNQQAESEFIVNQLRVLPKHRNRAIAALAKNDLSNNQRRIWLTVFKQFTRMHRDCLHWAGDALPSAQLVESWREFVETGAVVCDGQEKLISAKLESRKLTVNQRCALVTLFARVVKLSRDFEAYKDEMPAAGSPH
jgi:hypothetical protein